MLRRQIAVDSRPGRSKVSRLVDVRIPVVHQVKVDDNVRSSRIEMGGLDACNGSPRGHAGDIFADIIPVGAAILRVPDLPVIRSRPNKPLLFLRWGNGENYFPIELSQVV